MALKWLKSQVYISLANKTRHAIEVEAQLQLATVKSKKFTNNKQSRQATQQANSMEHWYTII